MSAGAWEPGREGWSLFWNPRDVTFGTNCLQLLYNWIPIITSYTICMLIECTLMGCSLMFTNCLKLMGNIIDFLVLVVVQLHAVCSFNFEIIYAVAPSIALHLVQFLYLPIDTSLPV